MYKNLKNVSGRLLDPKVWIMGDESGDIHLQLSDEFAARAFVAVCCRIEAAVNLFERLKGEAWKTQPGRSYLRFLSDGQTQAANRQQVGGRAEVQIEIDATRHWETLRSIEPPAASRINREFDLDQLVSNPASDFSG